jgi:hypothetical protein
MGRLVELLCAQWLETDSWRIVGLEAFQEGPDLTAEREGDGQASFEVKSLGQEDSDFEAVVASLHGPPTAQTKDLYAAMNFVTFRVYEAAKQLQQVKEHRTVLFVVNETTWHNVEFQLENNWVDWRNAKLYGSSSHWRAFMDAQRKRYPNVDEELAEVIRSVDDIWILRLRYGFELSKELAFTLAD